MLTQSGLCDDCEQKKKNTGTTRNTRWECQNSAVSNNTQLTLSEAPCRIFLTQIYYPCVHRQTYLGTVHYFFLGRHPARYFGLITPVTSSYRIGFLFSAAFDGVVKTSSSRIGDFICLRRRHGSVRLVSFAGSFRGPNDRLSATEHACAYGTHLFLLRELYRQIVPARLSWFLHAGT